MERERTALKGPPYMHPTGRAPRLSSEVVLCTSKENLMFEIPEVRRSPGRVYISGIRRILG